MTALRQRFIEDLQLQGKSDRTQQAYVRAVRMLAEHFHTPPDQLTDEQIRQYFLYVRNTRHWSFSTMKQALCAIKTFYTQTLHRDWGILDVIRPPKSQTLPDVLTHDEVQRLLQAVRLPHYRSCLTAIYSCGLRISEGTRLQVTDLDSARRSGAVALFGGKYGERVKVYTVGDFSKEVCGGPHVENTGELGRFRILKEESSSAGVRRIRAVLESEAGATPA